MSKANRNLKQDERAEIGIGTMIVFIATILVSAVAAGVLINTAQKLQAKSQQTGTEATQNVVGALTVLRVDGVNDGSEVQELDVTVQLSAGADPLDLSKLVVLIDDGATQTKLVACDDSASDPTATPATFTPGDWLRPNDSTGCSVMKTGDLVQLQLGSTTKSLGIAASTRISVSLVPNHGSTALVSFTTPDGFGDSTRVPLF